MTMQHTVASKPFCVHNDTDLLSAEPAGNSLHLNMNAALVGQHLMYESDVGKIAKPVSYMQFAYME